MPYPDREGSLFAQLNVQEYLCHIHVLKDSQIRGVQYNSEFQKYDLKVIKKELNISAHKKTG